MQLYLPNNNVRRHLNYFNCFSEAGAADGSKPSDKVHLFDFLGEKFPDAQEPTKESIASAAANSSHHQNGRRLGENSNNSSRTSRGNNSTHEGEIGLLLTHWYNLCEMPTCVGLKSEHIIPMARLGW